MVRIATTRPIMMGMVTSISATSSPAQNSTTRAGANRHRMTPSGAWPHAAGAGITGTIAKSILGCGVDAITLGDHVWDQRGWENEIGQMERVFVVGPNNRAVLRLVKSGATRGDRVEILSGLDDGERVVVAPPAALREGQTLELLP